MGFFGKLFEKKICDLCGKEIGILGNRKLEDGNCCKDCARKLSPWFNERRHSTVAEIREQLAYREANRAAVAAFHVTQTLGLTTKVLLDEDAGTFMVTDQDNLEAANPDVVRLSDITGCELDINQRREESMQEVTDAEGNTEERSYSPPRYFYSYDFYIEIHVNNPYFDMIRFRLNNLDVDVDYIGLFGRRQMEGSTKAPDIQMCRQNAEYKQFEDLGLAIRAALTRPRSQPQEQSPQEKTARVRAFCPNCGAPATPDRSGNCAYCGGALTL